MAPQFNLLAGRFTAVGDSFAYGSATAQDGRTWIAFTVHGTRYSSYVERRRVKGVELVEFN